MALVVGVHSARCREAGADSAAIESQPPATASDSVEELLPAQESELENAQHAGAKNTVGNAVLVRPTSFGYQDYALCFVAVLIGTLILRKLWPGTSGYIHIEMKERREPISDAAKALAISEQHAFSEFAANFRIGLAATGPGSGATRPSGSNTQTAKAAKRSPVDAAVSAKGR
jgi:hypothetical protein